MNEPADVEASVAVIVVHGVADQPRGETAAAVATQLALETGGAVARSDEPLPVPPCAPAVQYQPWNTEGWRNLPQAVRKSWFHALRSDFLDPQLGGADSQIASPKNLPRAPLANSARGKADVAADVRYTDFLVAKAYAGRESTREQPPPVHDVARFDLAGKDANIAVFEMHWADLSRLSGFVPRILAELFTILFDLVRIGGHAVSMHAGVHADEPPAMTTLGRLHRLADHLYTRALAMLTLQLMLCALVVFVASALSGHERGLCYSGAVLAGVGVAAWFAQSRRFHSWLWGSIAGIAVGAGLGVAVHVAARAQASPLVGVALGATLVVLAWAYWRLLNYWEQRFRAVLGFGLVFGLVTAACLAWAVIEQDGLHRTDAWMVGALRAAELLLLCQMIVWCVLALVCTATVVCGWWAGQRGGTDSAVDARRRVIRTGRLGLFSSMGAFVVFVMAFWALINPSLCGALASMPYDSMIFDVRATPLSSCDWLDVRIAGSTETFALVALLLSLFVGFIVVVLVPCIAAEVGLRRFKAADIGGWLTRGYQAIERLLGWGGWLATLGTVIAGLLLAESLAIKLGGAAWAWTDAVSSILQVNSASMLQAIVYAVAGTTTGLIAIGRIAAKRLQGLRVPLDAALDVDVHFREFPRAAISRVLIAERYIALLEHVLAKGFGRIVIVAHSQGTVITADLLRYLHQRPGLLDPARRGEDDRLTRLGSALERAQVDLLTLGCPLRQLYAQRFPSLYQWANDPDPCELGVRRWFNAWGSADYVGRWLWNAAAGAPKTPPLEAGAHDYGGAVLTGPGWQDRCIGGVAHTHYFEPEQTAVRQAMVELLQPPPRRAPP